MNMELYNAFLEMKFFPLEYKLYFYKQSKIFMVYSSVFITTIILYKFWSFILNIIFNYFEKNDDINIKDEYEINIENEDEKLYKVQNILKTLEVLMDNIKKVEMDLKLSTWIEEMLNYDLKNEFEELTLTELKDYAKKEFKMNNLHHFNVQNKIILIDVIIAMQKIKKIKNYIKLHNENV